MKDEPARGGLSGADLRTRYEALGAEKTFFGVAAVGTIFGAILPLIQTPSLFFLNGTDVRFYNLGVSGWVVFLALAAATAVPILRPALSTERRAIPLLAVAGGLVGVLLELCAVSSYGLFGTGPGAYAWLIAAVALVAGYSRRIIVR